MATPEHIAASRAEQDQEGFSRVPVTDAGAREADPHQEPLDDTSAPPDPEPGPRSDGGDDDQGGPRGRPKLIHMSPSDEARLNIAKRFRRDDEGRVPYNGDPNDPEMLYGKHGRAQQDEPPEPEPAPAPAPAPQNQPRMITQTIRGKQVTKSEDEWLADAAKVTAADSYLEEGRQLLENARQINRDRNNRERDPDDHHRPDGRDNAQDDRTDPSLSADPQHPEDELEGAIEEVRYGTDSKEAAKRLRTAITKEADKAADDRQIQRLVGQDDTKSANALKAFIEANADIANDKIALGIMEQQIYDIQREELVAAGIDESKLPKDNKTLAKWHQFQRIHGSPVSNQEQILTKAKGRLDNWRGGPSRQQPQQQRKDPARVEVSVDRNARRAAMPSQPTRTMAPPQPRPQAQPAQRADRSDVIANMRKARGQIVA